MHRINTWKNMRRVVAFALASQGAACALQTEEFVDESLANQEQAALTQNGTDINGLQINGLHLVGGQLVEVRSDTGGDDLEEARRSDRGRRDRFPPSRRSEGESFRAFRAARWRLERPEFKPLGFHPREFPDPGTCEQIQRFSRGPRDRKPAF
jgi:hypothetical protein